MNEMFIKRKIVKRGNVKIRLTPEEIKEAAEIYSKSADIISKLDSWIDYIKVCRNVLDTVASFKIEFNGEYKKEYYEDIKDDWYEFYKITYSLNNGLALCVVSGAWDRIGDKVSHTGMDIYLSLKENDSSDEEFIVSIFDESKLQDFQKDIDILFEKLKSEVKQDE